ncbi:GntR family transcriptional regulator [Sphaerochaeta sp. PS]|jgi:DNA-binding transcriptional regulator YhcF (GntR family)|uniref:GntR family transcriptional regulator n=1 Tax=Sphaerochaeta sp. PS TaxID=3076336 RepID=UPI0028A43834|nr:GntR family transcriptional regulator [Sphaerochaeta sp. PS]MDT4761663.1 GntR family transcriptional regulator [Sphaerochaeta sp. PS]
MQFNNSSPIYVQITQYIHDLIINTAWVEEERIPSVRDMAMQLEVNPNTVIRAYSILQDEGILENQRGIGYFTAKDARTLVLKKKREQFIRRELPNLFASMRTLGITLEDIETYFLLFKKEQNDHEIES